MRHLQSKLKRYCNYVETELETLWCSFFSKPQMDKDDLDYISEYEKANLNLPTPFATTLIYIIAAFFLTILIWAYYSEIDEITYSEGRVVPPSKIKTIQSLEGGILKELLVQEGEYVTKGQILLRIDETQFKSLYREEKSKYLHVLASVSRLRAEMNQDDSVIFPSELDDYPVIRRLELDLFKERHANLAESLATLQKSADFLKQELELTKPLIKEGAISAIEVLRLEKQLNELNGRYEEKKDAYYESVHKELTVFNAELARLREVIASREDKLKRTTIISPVDGIVQTIHIITRGGVISPGMKIMEIVPREPYLLIEAKVKPEDIGFIRPGQDAKVKFTAYDFAIFGGLAAKVIYISADTVTDENGAAFYTVRVKTRTNHLNHGGKKLSIKIGMQTSVDVVTGKKSILTYIMKPIIRAKETAFTER